MAALLLSLVEPDADDDRARAVGSLLTTREYGRAELMLVAREAPFAPMYGPRLRLDVVDGIVREHRAARAKARSVTAHFTAAEVDRAVRAGLFVPGDFYVSGTDARTGEPTHRLRPDALRREGMAESSILAAQIR